MKTDACVEERNGGRYIGRNRVSLDSVVYAFVEGQTAEGIAQAFPVLTLEQAYGPIAFCLAHREDVDRYLERSRKDSEGKRREAWDHQPGSYQKLAAARRSVPSS